MDEPRPPSAKRGSGAAGRRPVWARVAGRAGLALLLGLGLLLAAPVEQAARLYAARNDPAALADAQLRDRLTPGRVAAEIDAALSAGDADLADSLLALADRQGVAVDEARRAAVARAMEGSTLDTALTFARGAVAGDAPGAAGLSGAFAGDLVGIGDVRDLAREGWRYAQGEPTDEIVLGLAAAGLGITALTWTSLGEAAPLRGGLTLMKALRKGGRLSAGLARSLGRLVREAVDLPGLGTAARALRRLDLPAARDAAAAALRPSRLAPLGAMSRDTVRLFDKAGTRGVEDAFALARTPREVGLAARLSEGMGRATRGALKILGRGALLLGEGLAIVAGWLLTGVVYAFWIALAAARLGRRMGRVRFRRRRRPGAAPARPLARPAVLSAQPLPA